MFFTAVVEIGYIRDEDNIFILAFDDIFQEGQDLIPIRVGQTETSRVIGRRIHDDNRVVLFGNHSTDMFFEALEIKFPIVRQ